MAIIHEHATLISLHKRHHSTHEHVENSRIPDVTDGQ